MQNKYDNLIDKLSMKVIKSNETVSHLPCEYSRISWYFLAFGGNVCIEVTSRSRHSKRLCGGLEIPCRLLFSCSSKVKNIINCLKELMENKNHK